MKKFLIIACTLFLTTTTIFAHGGRLNSSGCHNDNVNGGYHCHNGTSSTTTTTSNSYSTTIKTPVEREMSDEEITKELKKGIRCYNITKNESDREICDDLQNEGDLYEPEEILKELKKSKNCYMFTGLKHNITECNDFKKNEFIYTIEEIKKETYSFKNCYKIQEFKKDYGLCLTESKQKEEQTQKNTKNQAKIDDINSKIEIFYNKKPEIIAKLSLQIAKIKPKLKEGTDPYILIIAIEEKIAELKKNNENKILEQSIGEKNIFNDSFSKSKKYLEQEVYNNKILFQKSFYCGCDYSSDKFVDINSCGYQNNGKYISRSEKIEWEHVVPAEAFGQSFIEWREGDEKCIDSKGEKFTGRNCASKVNMEYRYMESDMYNLVPSIGAINALRSNYSFSMIEGEEREFGTCDMEIKDRKVEPQENARGDIARIYMYMNITYPGRGIISDKNSKLFEVWNNSDPVSNEECERYKKIKSIQKNENIILKEKCLK